MIALFFALAITATPEGEQRRIALLVGNNLGGEGRDELKYAEDDARQLRDVLEQLGDVGWAKLLTGASADALDRAFDEISASIRKDGRPTTLFFFYSGHSDGAALLMNESRYPFTRVRKKLETSAAKLFVAFVDACESGKIIRAKGGRPIPMIDLDLSHLDRSLEGGIMLASTGNDELAQESDELRGSFFTHYLVSGLRGGADTSGDRRVSLEEIYQFVYHHTLDRTRTSRLGPQHPTYGFNVDGRGELVLTWMNDGMSYLILSSESEGTYFVRDARRGKIHAEVDKKSGVELRIALAAGRYEVSRIEGLRVFAGEVDVAEKTEHRFDDRTMIASPLKTLQGKGERDRFALGLGYFISSGYFQDSGVRHGAEVRWGWELGAFRLGLLGLFSTSRYTRSDALTIRAWELGGGAFVEGELGVARDLRVLAGAELRGSRAEQNVLPELPGPARGEGVVVQILGSIGLSYALDPLVFTAGINSGPASFGTPDGLVTRWTIGGRFEAKFVYE